MSVDVTPHWIPGEKAGAVGSTSEGWRRPTSFYALLFIVLHRCGVSFLFVFYKMKARSSTGKKIKPGITTILALLWWSETKLQHLQAMPGLPQTGSMLHKYESTGSPLAPSLNATAPKGAHWKPTVRPPRAQGLSFPMGSAVQAHLVSVSGQVPEKRSLRRGLGYRSEGERAADGQW